MTLEEFDSLVEEELRLLRQFCNSQHYVTMTRTRGVIGDSRPRHVLTVKKDMGGFIIVADVALSREEKGFCIDDRL